MAIRFNAVGDTLDLTTALPTNASFTAICDAQVISDVGAPAVQPLYMALNAALTHGYYLLWEGGTNGVMEMVTLAGGAVVDQYSFPSRPVEGRAFCFYLRCSGTGANQFECAWRYPDSAWVRGTADLTGAVNQATTIYLNAVAATYYTNHRKQNLKIWTRCLSQQEIDVESQSATPVYLNALHSYFPLSGANDFVDRGPYRRPLTRAGTNETEYFHFPRPAKRRRIPVPYVAAGGGPYTITAEQGSYSITGQAAAVRAARKLAAAQGSYSLTGQSAGLTAGRKLAAAQGSYALTGQAAVLNLARRLPAAQGTYSLTGQAAGVAAGRKIAAAQGSYSLSGQSATLRASRQIAAAQGAYALTGQLVTVRLARKVAAGQGSYNLTGQDAALNYSGSGAKTLTAAYGSYSLAGQTAGLVAARRLSAGQGWYVLTGQAAGLAVGRNLAAAQGTYSLSGQSVTLTYTPASRVLTAAYGVYTLTGYDVALTASGVAVFEDEPRWTHLPPAAAGRIGFTIADPSGYRMGTPVARPGSRRIGRSKA